MTNISNPYCRKDTNTWFVKVDGKPKQLAPKGSTEEQARQQWETLRLKVAAENGEQDEQVAKTTVKAMTQIYFTECCKTFKPATLYQKHYILDDFANIHGNRPISTITPLNIRQFVEQHKQWNASTQNIAYRVLNAMFVRLSEYGVINNPVKGVFNKPSALTKGENVLIPEVEYKAVLKASSELYRPIIELCWLSGARPSEILTVTAEEINLQHKEIVKKVHKTMHKGKDRVILLTDRAFEIITTAMVKHPQGLLFPGRHEQQITASRFAAYIREKKDELGLTSAWTPYSFRHNFAVTKLASVKDIYTVASWLGNTVSVCEKHYGKAINHARSTRHLLETPPDTKAAG